MMSSSSGWLSFTVLWLLRCYIVATLSCTHIVCYAINIIIIIFILTRRYIIKESGGWRVRKTKYSAMRVKWHNRVLITISSVSLVHCIYRIRRSQPCPYCCSLFFSFTRAAFVVLHYTLAFTSPSAFNVKASSAFL